MSPREGMLSVDQLRVEVDAGVIDTVLVAIPDMQGRLQGKRLHARFFLDSVLQDGTEGCSYLLAVDVDMNTVTGYAMSSWENGYGDFVMRPDLSTLRRVPWHEGTAMVLCDLEKTSGGAVAPSPRQILREQSARLGSRGWHPLVATELEFLVFRDTYEAAQVKHYIDLVPANLYNIDYSLLGTARVEPLLRRIRNSMAGAGMLVESAKGECNFGQQEIGFLYDKALVTCDNHSVYKLGAKEIAAQDGVSITFMAKYDQREGNSCHVHFSLVGEDGSPVFASASEPTLPGAADQGDRAGFSPVLEHFLAGQLAGMRELTLLFAPNINSYKRFVEGSFAPTAVRWGHDNRTCALRVIGHGRSLRFENRLPGGDVNPYLAVAAIIAAGLDGIERELPLESAFVGNAYTSDSETVPTTLREALALWETSELAQSAFGPEVVDHYANMARVEIAAFDRVTTDWERARGFERL